MRRLSDDLSCRAAPGRPVQRRTQRVSLPAVIEDLIGWLNLNSGAVVAGATVIYAAGVRNCLGSGVSDLGLVELLGLLPPTTAQHLNCARREGDCAPAEASLWLAEYPPWPLIRCAVCWTWALPTARSTSAQRSPSNSLRLIPVMTAMRTRAPIGVSFAAESSRDTSAAEIASSPR